MQTYYRQSRILAKANYNSFNLPTCSQNSLIIISLKLKLIGVEFVKSLTLKSYKLVSTQQMFLFIYSGVVKTIQSKQLSYYRGGPQQTQLELESYSLRLLRYFRVSFLYSSRGLSGCQIRLRSSKLDTKKGLGIRRPFDVYLSSSYSSKGYYCESLLSSIYIVKQLQCSI